MTPNDDSRDSAHAASTDGRSDFDRAQQAMAAIEPPALRTEDVPLGRAVGRVLAESPSPALPAGTRLTGRHVPQLASAGRPTVRVFQKLKVGVLSISDADEAGRPADPALAGPMIAALLDGLGAAGIAAPGAVSNGETAGAVLDMLLDPCRIVLVAGAMTAKRQAQIDEALAARGATLSRWALCEGLGAGVSAACFDGKVVVCLPAGIAEAFVAFALLVSPLIRRFQGRAELLPPVRAATIRQPGPTLLPAGWFVFARETELQSALRLLPIAGSTPIDAIARADGIIRSVEDATPGSLFEASYYPFSAWLR